jgi:hypothetical protein
MRAAMEEVPGEAVADRSTQNMRRLLRSLCGPGLPLYQALSPERLRQGERLLVDKL